MVPHTDQGDTLVSTIRRTWHHASWVQTTTEGTSPLTVWPHHNVEEGNGSLHWRIGAWEVQVIGINEYAPHPIGELEVEGRQESAGMKR